MNDVLADVVHDLKRSLGVDVCSVHLADATSGDCVLRATDGLAPSAIGSVHFAPGVGLVGTVFASRRPLRVDAAQKDPRFQRIEAFGETVYRSFLGVPIVREGRAIGVLSVRQISQRAFTDKESELLARAAATLAPFALFVQRPPPSTAAGPRAALVLSGIAASPGTCVGVGVAHVGRMSSRATVNGCLTCRP